MKVPRRSFVKGKCDSGSKAVEAIQALCVIVHDWL